MRAVYLLALLFDGALAAGLRRLDTNYDKVKTALNTFIGGSSFCASKTNSDGSKDYTCKTPGYNITLTGSSTDVASKLNVCERKAGVGNQCRAYTFGGSMTVDQIIAKAFPSNAPHFLSDYYMVKSNLLFNYNGKCNKSGTSTAPVVKCSMPGSTATLTGKGTTPTLVKLTMCTTGTSSGSKCTDYDFSKMDATDVIAKAFPSAKDRSHEEYNLLTEELLTYFNGNCTLEKFSYADNIPGGREVPKDGKVVMICMNDKYFARFTSVNMVNPAGSRINVCDNKGFDANGYRFNCHLYIAKTGATTDDFLSMIATALP